MQLSGLKTRVKRAIKYRVLSPLRHLVENASYGRTQRESKLRMLLISDFECYTSDQQYAPFDRYRKEIADQLGMTSLITDLSGAIALLTLANRRFDLIGLKFSFRTPGQNVIEFVQKLRTLAPTVKLIYFDGDDDLAIQWSQILSACDLYVKKHKYKDENQYNQKTVGKSNLTHYVHENFGQDFSTDFIKENNPISLELSKRIVVGWNIALDDKIENLRDKIHSPTLNSRPIDIVCRATVNSESWLFHLRKSIAPTLEPLRKKFNVVTPSHRVSQEIYYQEMLSAKLCISPFGYGEICWRDFEAILCGCLVVKPDMSHVETQPNLFIPYETYIPVAWDYSNLAKECERYLNDPVACDRIASNARSKLVEYYEQKQFLASLNQILSRMDLA